MASMGEKVRRKVVSPLRCLTVNDMMFVIERMNGMRSSVVSDRYQNINKKLRV